MRQNISSRETKNAKAPRQQEEGGVMEQARDQYA